MTRYPLDDDAILIDAGSDLLYVLAHVDGTEGNAGNDGDLARLVLAGLVGVDRDGRVAGRTPAGDALAAELYREADYGDDDPYDGR